MEENKNQAVSDKRSIKLSEILNNPELKTFLEKHTSSLVESYNSKTDEYVFVDKEQFSLMNKWLNIFFAKTLL